MHGAGLKRLFFLWILLAGCRPTWESAPLAESAGDSETRPVQQAPQEGPSLSSEPLGPGRRMQIDGRYADWGPTEALAVHPKPATLSKLDVARMDATSRGSDLYLSLWFAAELNLSRGASADGYPTLRLTTERDEVLLVDLRRRRASWRGELIPLYDLDFVFAPSYASHRFELHFALGELGVKFGEVVAIEVTGVRAPPPLEYRFKTPFEPALAPQGLDRAQGTRLRFASLNCQRGGLVDPLRGPAVGRLLNAAAADVYLLQELGMSTAPEIAAALADAVPGGTEMQVLKQGNGSIVGNAIASRHPLIGIPTLSSRFVGGVVLADPPMAVFGVHLPCCGFVGSDEDVERLDTATKLWETIRGFATGQLGQALVPYQGAPIVVMGDFNDVGSSRLRSKLTTSRGAPIVLEQWLVPHFDKRWFYTWFNADSGFSPSTLDLVFHSPTLKRRRGYVLDTRTLSKAVLGTAGLLEQDSAATDHLLIVADF